MCELGWIQLIFTLVKILELKFNENHLIRKYVVYKSIYLIHSLSNFLSLLHPPLLAQEYLHTNLLAI